MYLARTENGSNRYEFVLRESYRRGECFVCRDVASLGPDPGVYLVYSGDNAFHIDEDLVQRLHAQGVGASYSELEDLLFPFVDPAIRLRLQPFRERSRYRNWKRTDDAARRRALEESHCFDRRRLHYLRLGRSSVQAVQKTPALYTILLDKSRDEIEQLILMQEQALHARDLYPYLFSIFDLQRHFRESYARSVPHALERERVDACFLEEFCALAKDVHFWRGYPRGRNLPRYLLRYLFMYFDQVPGQRAGDQYASSGRRGSFRHTGAGPGPSGRGMSRRDALAFFSLNGEELGALDKKALTRLYRKKAQEMHPDKGGDAESFIRLTSAYEALLPSLR